MKYVLFILSFLLLSRISHAQDCASFYLFRQNATVQYAVYNKKGNANGTLLYHVFSQTAKGGNITSVLHTTLLNKEGKVLNTGASNIKCNNGTLLMDMKLFLPQQQTEQFNRANAKIKDAFLEYPGGLKNGDKLKDGMFSMEIDNNGIKQLLKMQITNRSVTGMEKINTKAGTWNCVVISYQVNLNIQTGPISIPLNFTAKEWFAPGTGIIKSESETGSTELVGIK
ncbi:MAG TPA: hypothetical protein PKV73_07775 [Agriterribacter sp.]|nr:hypothetical protein [Agriterribacter sp.]